MKSIRSTLPTIIASLTLIGLGAAACASSSSSVDPFEVADKEGSRTDILDEAGPPGNRSRRSRPSVDTDVPLYIIPEADAQPARAINADPQGWDLSTARTFNDRRNVESGANRWDGPDDASFRVAIDSDDSHLYFWVEVVDDTVVSSSPHNPLDAVVIWLRDPGLDALIESLPEALQDRLNLTVATAIAVTPDGEVARYGSGGDLIPNSVHVATRRTNDGYVVEAALGLEVFPNLHDLPPDDLAFRVEVLDTDDPSSQPPEKRLTMLPRSRDGEPRFAIYSTGGLLPGVSPESAPPRIDALGIWQQRSEGWVFQSVEYITPRWRVLEDLNHVAAQVEDRDPLPYDCTGPGNGMWLVEAYEASNRGQRVALVLCGTETRSGSCRDDSQSQLFWVALRTEDRQNWTIDRAHAVFDQPLNQCPFEAIQDQPRYRDFSLLPLDVVGSTVWGVGWHMERDEPLQMVREAGVTFVDPRAPDFAVGQTPLQKTRAFENSLTHQTSKVFFTDLNDNESMDICEIEEVLEHRCQSFNSDCSSAPRAREVLVHFKTWNAERNRFEDSLLHQHPRCRGSIRFSDFDGYQLIQVEDRLGLLPSRAQ